MCLFSGKAQRGTVTCWAQLLSGDIKVRVSKVRCHKEQVEARSCDYRAQPGPVDEVK